MSLRQTVKVTVSDREAGEEERQAAVFSSEGRALIRTLASMQLKPI